MKLRQRAFVFLAAVMLCGCVSAPQPGPAENAGLHRLGVELQFESADGSAVDSASLPGKPVPSFQLKPGSLFGISLFSPVDIGGFAGPQDDLVIDLDDWFAVATERSLQASDGRVSGGVRISPSETRFAQVLPLVYVQAPGKQTPTLLGKHSYFMDAGRQVANLIYFDRACRLEGTFRPHSGRRTVTVDIGIEGPGFYLLSYVAGVGNEKYWLVLSPHAELISLMTTL
jgi:hypothetical protein